MRLATVGCAGNEIDRSLWSLGVEVGALWRGTLHPAAETLLRELKETGRVPLVSAFRFPPSAFPLHSPRE